MNRPFNAYIYFILFLSVVGFPGPVFSQARVMSGILENHEIRLTTELVNGSESVPAIHLTPYFPGRMRFDSLTGALAFERVDGARIGLKIGDGRVYIGKGNTSEIRNPGIVPIRKNGRVYIPFYIVDTFLFPQVRFSEAASIGEDAPPSTAVTMEATPTPRPRIFTYPTPPSDNQITQQSFLPTPTPIPTFAFFTAYPSPTPVLDQPRQTLPIKIVLDPGNDSINPGAAAPSGIQEADLTLSICEKLETALRRNFDVILTRRKNDKTPLSNQQRIAIANESNGTIFVSVHCGALFTNDVSRAVVYFMNAMLDAPPPPRLPNEPPQPAHLVQWRFAYERNMAESLRLARAIHERLRPLYNITGAIKMDEHVRPGRLAILRGLSMPGVVVELGNLTHSATAQYLQREGRQLDIAEELAIAIADFLYERAGSSGYNAARR